MSRSRPHAARRATVLLAALLLPACASTGPAVTEWTPALVEDAGRLAVEQAIADCAREACGFVLPPWSAVRQVTFDASEGTLSVDLNDAAAETAWREEGVLRLRAEVLARLGTSVPVRTVTLRSLGLALEELVPNAYRERFPIDASRHPAVAPAPRPQVTRTDGPPPPSRGLAGRHVALWPSHGWYYERDLDRWEWQRARLFTTVEDVLPASFVLPFLVPMLERAGATVWLPRERDTQTAMAVVDNDAPDGEGYRETGSWSTGSDAGFAAGSPPYGPGENPFRAGTWRYAPTDPAATDSAIWHPDIPATGDYAVTVAFGAHPEATSAARYTVRHAGGVTRFTVDQTMAAGTWVHLGFFRFLEGAGPDSASVILTAEGEPGRVVTADAVRFGGGTGLIERAGRTSGRPRWLEAARYHLQYAGLPDTLVYSLSNGEDDYGDDYRGRGEWVNYLRGAPFGPNDDRSMPGLGIPVDLSLAFHTDAGTAGADTTIGTLLIYSSDGADTLRVFPDGMSRFANRDFADILQTQLVRDIRALHDPAWSRRPIWDREYSEAFRPNVPAALLELLSHQNFADMRRALDPAFRSDVSRSMYKAMVRFLAAQYGEPEPVIQPLAPDHLSARVVRPGIARVEWRPVEDPLEPSASPDRYVVYTRVGEGGYDNGQVVTGTAVELPVEAGALVGYRVAGLNDGGEGAWSEEAALTWLPDRPSVLVVSAFDRVSEPAAVDRPPFRGFLDLLDHGVADGMDLSFVGSQHEFDVAVPWQDDDDPGHGASWGSHETLVYPGNTRDFAAVHGRSLRAAGYGFDTVSDEGLMADSTLTDGYAVVDLALGEERETTPGGTPRPAFRAFPEALIRALERHADRGGALLVSGSYVGTELAADTASASPTARFAKHTLGIRHRTGHAVATGAVVPVPGGRMAALEPFRFVTGRQADVYGAEAPDALDPAGEGGETVFRYGETNMSAGVAFRTGHRALTLGFPFETIASRAARDRVMAAMLAWLLETPRSQAPD